MPSSYAADLADCIHVLETADFRDRGLSGLFGTDQCIVCKSAHWQVGINLASKRKAHSMLMAGAWCVGSHRSQQCVLSFAPML